MSIIDKERIKSAFPLLKESVRWGKRRKNELSALNRHLARRKFQKKNKQINKGIIKVVFICQYIPAWSKNKQLYERLRSDERFHIILLCIPNRISANQLLHPEDLSNDTYDYFAGHGYQEAVDALIGEDQWFDLREFHPDYVFYNRYDRSMPRPYTSTAVSAYAKVCLISYDFALLRREEAMFDKPFAANTYCCFAESEGKRREFLRWNSILCKLNLSHAVCCGITAVENVLKAQTDACPAWRFSHNDYRVIYAPRWTQDPTWGGSSFLKYRELFLQIADDHPEIDILVRPHPLMFDHFISIGVMTPEEVDAYHEACEERNNIRLDAEKEYHATFWNSSVLICDYSSVIIEYFVTGKPIIYLTYNKDIVYTDQMNEMLSCSYIVHSGKELREVLENLALGIDPLAPKRREICERMISETGSANASENMKQFLISKYAE